MIIPFDYKATFNPNGSVDLAIEPKYPERYSKPCYVAFQFSGMKNGAWKKYVNKKSDSARDRRRRTRELDAKTTKVWLKINDSMRKELDVLGQGAEAYTKLLSERFKAEIEQICKTGALHPEAVYYATENAIPLWLANEILLSDGQYTDPKNISKERGWCVIRKFNFSYAITANVDPDGCGQHWAYHSYVDAKEALEEWGGDGDPSGNWIKSKGGPNGEYNNPHYIPPGGQLKPLRKIEVTTTEDTVRKFIYI